VKDEEMGKRVVSAFKDLVVQCGSKPDKKEIY
jgi:hypothetical protein